MHAEIDQNSRLDSLGLTNRSAYSYVRIEDVHSGWPDHLPKLALTLDVAKPLEKNSQIQLMTQQEAMLIANEKIGLLHKRFRVEGLGGIADISFLRGEATFDIPKDEEPSDKLFSPFGEDLTTDMRDLPKFPIHMAMCFDENDKVVPEFIFRFPRSKHGEISTGIFEWDVTGDKFDSTLNFRAGSEVLYYIGLPMDAASLSEITVQRSESLTSYPHVN